MAKQCSLSILLQVPVVTSQRADFQSSVFFVAFLQSDMSRRRKWCTFTILGSSLPGRKLDYCRVQVDTKHTVSIGPMCELHSDSDKHYELKMKTQVKTTTGRQSGNAQNLKKLYNMIELERRSEFPMFKVEDGVKM